MSTVQTTINLWPDRRIDVIIPAYGDEKWYGRAQELIHSLLDQTAHPDQWEATMYVGKTVAESRNLGAAASPAEWLVFVDADDRLHRDYLKKMLETIDGLGPGDWLVQPATVSMHGDDEPNVIERAPLIDRNFMVIGTAVRREQFLRVGGFREFPMLEDWELWLRCWIDGANFAASPESVYVVDTDSTGRNHDRNKIGGKIYTQIRREHRAAAQRRAQQ